MAFPGPSVESHSTTTYCRVSLSLSLVTTTPENSKNPDNAHQCFFRSRIPRKKAEASGDLGVLQRCACEQAAEVRGPRSLGLTSLRGGPSPSCPPASPLGECAQGRTLSCPHELAQDSGSQELLGHLPCLEEAPQQTSAPLPVRARPCGKCSVHLVQILILCWPPCGLGQVHHHSELSLPSCETEITAYLRGLTRGLVRSGTLRPGRPNSPRSPQRAAYSPTAYSGRQFPLGVIRGSNICQMKIPKV